ncbi:MAG: MerR family transcriptional regulator [Coriobacteriia bacterium]|nr:MerR family transcriptional regulator [Coriobacteriia bacterium]
MAAHEHQNNREITSASSSSKPLLTVGELAKRMNVSVRTIQYYDREGLLEPKMKTESGHRLYSDEEVVKLYQILSLKDLGFSLKDIKYKISNMRSPQDVSKVLKEQIGSVEEKLRKLQEQKRILKALEVEVLRGKSVNFTRYAAIITSLQMGNEFYWAIAHMDDELLSQLFSGDGNDGEAFIGSECAQDLIDQMGKQRVQALALLDEGVSPDSPEGQKLAQAWWETCMRLVHGDVALLGRMSFAIEEAMSDHPELGAVHARSLEFIGPALQAYFENTTNEKVIADAEKLFAYLQANES